MAKPDQAFITNVFNKIDDDGNGEISEAELLGAFKSFDTDGDNCVSREEFATHFQPKFSATAEQSERIFVKLDRDGDGNLDLNELGVFFKDMDKDGDGTVSRDEFVAYWTKLLSA